MAIKHLLLLALLGIIVVASPHITAFQSDELAEDEDEWGLVGGEPGLIKTRASIDKGDSDFRGSVSAGAKAKNPAPATSTNPTGVIGDNLLEFPLEHSFGDSKFSLAGTFSARLRTSASGRQSLTKLRLARNQLSNDEQKLFEDLVREDGFYRVRVPASLINPRNSYVMTSIKARCLAAAGLKERFDLNLDQGNLIGLTYSPTGDCTYPRPQVFPSAWTFDTLIVSRSSEQAPRLIPSESMYIPKEGEKTIEGEDGVKVVVEKTFWQKYWMYIVPFGLVVVNAITQIANMPEDPPAGQAGTAPAAPAAPVQRIAGSGGRRR